MKRPAREVEPADRTSLASSWRASLVGEGYPALLVVAVEGATPDGSCDGGQR